MFRDYRSAGAATERLLRQRTALADFGAAALAATDLDRVLAEATRLCADALGVPFCKVLEHRRDEGMLVVRAAAGWPHAVVGYGAPADCGGPGALAVRSGRPVVVADLRGAAGTDLPDIYARHGIVSAAIVPIFDALRRPRGALAVAAREPRGFGQHDVDFLRDCADVLVVAVRAQRRSAALRAESEARLVLLREQQHRLRNNLMAVAATLQRCERGAAGEGSRARLGGVRRQVFAMASLYDHLLGAGLSGGQTGLRDFLAVLCAGAGDFHGLAERGVVLAFEADDGAVPTPIDTCTAVGIVVNELIANAAEHAFGAECGGRIAVRLRRGEGGAAVVTVEDDGVGVPPGAENGGVGLDLARKLVERMGSSLVLRSAPGRTAWTVALPAPPRLGDRHRPRLAGR